MNTAVVPLPKAPLVSGERPAAIVPQNIEQVWRLAELAAKSGLAPRDMASPEKCAVAILHGLEIGLPPMQALQRIAVINGRPTIWGDAALGLVRASRLLEWIKEEIHGDGDAMVAACTVKRTGEPEAIERTFSVDDAKAAGLWRKSGPWQQYPKRMLQMRARAFALRDVFPDVTGGMYLAEEAEDAMRNVTLIEPPAPPAIEPPTEAPGSPAASAAADAHTIEGVVILDEEGERPATAADLDPPAPDAPSPYPKPGAETEIPAFLDRRPQPAPVEPPKPEPKADEFDVAGWLRDLEGAASGCNTLDELIAVQNTVQIPAGRRLRKSNPEAWQKGKDIVLTASGRIMADASDEA